ncbi:beta-hexosaminidase subunit beta-like [Aricia agestis]|uniref:beta-hexosaminidase subunit beta-like n=1 Tax=Aricia agestis TaxID=91739 RepID=UPI001C20965A|nr:beta-hexosaminidase subunit beta-like [Aricia agestis]
MFTRIILFCCGMILVTGYDVVNPGPRYPPTKGEVWPKPQHETKEDIYYSFHPSHFKVEVTKETCETLTNAIDRYSYVLRTQHRRAGLTRSHPHRDVKYHGTINVLQVKLEAPCEQLPYFGMDESYELNVSNTSILKSRSLWGIIRGLETVSQLFYVSDDRNEILINKTQISDFPSYQHRGLLLDTSRHYITVTNIARTIDAMAMNKMNVLHWHIVDDQSFPYQSEKFPELSEKGAYASSMVYTKEDIQRIVEYARDRGIRVVPEFDVPGHTRSWGNAYPNILTECYENNQLIGLGPMDPTKNFTYKLLRDLFEEVQAWFPDQYFHIGGDEVLLECWASNPSLRQYMRNHNLTVTELHALFMRTAIPLLKNGSKVIVWQEVFDEGVSLAKDTLIQVWKNSWVMEMVRVLNSGHQVLFSSSWYLDHLDKNWQYMYQADPRAMVVNATGNRTLAAGVVGGEACMWGEMVDDRNVINRVWPRASAVAERLWSSGEEGTSWYQIPLAVYNRLEEHTCRMIRQGIDAQPPSAPGFCVA